MFPFVVFFMFEYLENVLEISMRANVDKNTFDLVLKKNHEHYQSDAHEFVYYRACKPHVEDLIGEHPDDYEREYAVKQRERAAALHQSVQIIEHYGDYEDVDDVLYSELYHCRLWGDLETDMMWVSSGILRW